MRSLIGKCERGLLNIVVKLKIEELNLSSAKRLVTSMAGRKCG